MSSTSKVKTLKVELFKLKTTENKTSLLFKFDGKLLFEPLRPEARFHVLKVSKFQKLTVRTNVHVASQITSGP